MFDKYKTIIRVIEAVQFTDKYKNRVFNSMAGQIATGLEGEKPILKVTTIHGEIAIVRIGDWIVKEEKLGFYYPVKDEVFRRGYIQSDE